MTTSTTALRSSHERPARRFAAFGRARAAALLAGASLAAVTALSVAAPADAAAGDITCPSTACTQVAAGLGSPADVAPDNARSVYLTYQSGQLSKVDLATGSVRTVATGLGNLRGVTVVDGAAYVTSFDGTLQQVTLATGSRRTLAAGLPPLFGVVRDGTTTYATDVDGEIVAVPDGGMARVIARNIGFSEGIAVDHAGLAYTADMMSGLIRQTDLTTGVSRALTAADYEPTSISVGDDGLVYFQVGDEVQRVDVTTTVQSHVTSIEGVNTFGFSLASSGNVYTVDSNGRLWQVSGVTAR